jgi:acyl-CoA synthetase (AMP-forming)/AMP-acid ligase II
MPPDLKLRAVPPALSRGYVRDGYWTDETLGEVLAGALERNRRHPFHVRSDVRPYVGTFADVHAMARHVAGWLRAHGVGPGDVVAFQLPNWAEAAAVFYGVTFLGAIVVPIPHFYGQREVGFILRQSGSRVFVTPDRFGQRDYLAGLDETERGLPDLEWVVVVGEVPSGATSFKALLDGDPLDAPVRVDPMAPALVAYTSGTTAEPKGVIHVHRTIVFEVRQLGSVQSARPLPLLVGAPVGHGIGMLSGLLLPVYPLGQPVHLIDVWDPPAVLASMCRDRVTAGSGSTYFLTSLLDHPDFTDEHRSLMPFIGLGGAPVPRMVAERADAMGISLVRSYGSTEHPSTTGSRHEAPRDKRLYTDGRPLPGVELRLADEAGDETGVGEPGEILSRGPDCFMGYTDPVLTERAFDADGWYATEDVGVKDAEGYLTITDRKKDIIIRGGENVSAAEVEELLMRMPGVAEVAVVAAPDPRLGEHACAFFRLRAGADAPDLSSVRDNLQQAGLAKQKWPEDVRVVQDFPRTPSGKIKKTVLRERLRTTGDL